MNTQEKLRKRLHIKQTAKKIERLNDDISERLKILGVDDAIFKLKIQSLDIKSLTEELEKIGINLQEYIKN